MTKKGAPIDGNSQIVPTRISSKPDLSQPQTPLKEPETPFKGTPKLWRQPDALNKAEVSMRPRTLQPRILATWPSAAACAENSCPAPASLKGVGVDARQV